MKKIFLSSSFSQSLTPRGKVLGLLFCFLILSGCTVEKSKPPLNLGAFNWTIEAGLAQDAAYQVYEEAKINGVDLGNGPCLSDYLFGNADYPETVWVLDIVHNPKSQADNLPENQCASYNEGKAKNFIEMDEVGRILKTYSPYLKDDVNL